MKRKRPKGTKKRLSFKLPSIKIQESKKKTSARGRKVSKGGNDSGVPKTKGTGRGRGRPRKNPKPEEDDKPKVKRGRGRPRKTPKPAED